MKAHHFSPDILEFLVLLLKHGVKYVIVGGEAVIFYGHARLTGDIDIFYQLSKKNVDRLYDVLVEFWSGHIPGVETPDELMEAGIIIQFGTPPNRIDLLNSIEAVTFQEAWDNKVTASIKLDDKDISIYFIGLDELIRNKERIGRPRDLDDLQFLKKTKEFL